MKHIYYVPAIGICQIVPARDSREGSAGPDIDRFSVAFPGRTRHNTGTWGISDKAATD